MSFADDEVVGEVKQPCPCGQPVVCARDLDKHIQDRLRAAEEMAKALRGTSYGHDCPNEWPCSGCWYDEAVASYEDTFKEDS